MPQFTYMSNLLMNQNVSGKEKILMNQQHRHLKKFQPEHPKAAPKQATKCGAYENAAASPHPSPVGGIISTPLRNYSSEH
jgi:hypothetical protein